MVCEIGGVVSQLTHTVHKVRALVALQTLQERPMLLCYRLKRHVRTTRINKRKFMEVHPFGIYILIVSILLDCKL